MATRLAIDQRLYTAAQLVIRARVFFDIWWFYQDADTRPIVKGTWDEVYDEFCIFDGHAHFVAFTVQIAAVFERRGDTINFPRLISELESTSSVPTDALTEVNADLARAKVISNKVKVLRHNLFAHRSASLSYADAFKMANLTPNDLRDLTEIALKIANGLLSARGLEWQMFNEFPRHDVERMFRRLGQPTQLGDP